MEIDDALVVYRNVLKEGVTTDGVVNVRLRLAVEVDDLGVAAALEIEDAVVVPAVLVITDELPLGIR